MNENELIRKFNELKQKKQAALVSFIPVGFPTLGESEKLAKQLVEGGTDVLELGVPFSDPVADGPAIQAASQKALANGANPKKCFEVMKKLSATFSELEFEQRDNFNTMKKLRNTHARVPLMILTYYNLLYKMGVEKFVREAAEAGVNAILAADLPIEEAGDFEKACRKHGVATVFIVAPNTPDERVKQIAEHTTGFVYLMAHFGVTGEKKQLADSTVQTVKRVKSLVRVPVCVGFGISSEEHVRKLAEAGADGVIVGSAFVKAVNEGRNAGELARKLKTATPIK